MKTAELISLSKEMSKEISYFFYRLKKIYYKIEELIDLAQVMERADMRGVKPCISIDSHIFLISADIEDLNRSVENFYSSDIIAKNYVGLFRDLFIQNQYNTNDKDFEQIWYHSINLITECFRIFRDEQYNLSKKYTELNDKIYYSTLDQSLKDRILTLLERASSISSLIQNTIQIPIGSINPRGYI